MILYARRKHIRQGKDKKKMSNKKAIICTIMLFICMVISLFVSTVVIRSDNGEVRLVDFIYPAVTGMWMGDKTMQFYHWLRKE